MDNPKPSAPCKRLEALAALDFLEAQLSGPGIPPAYRAHLIEQLEGLRLAALANLPAPVVSRLIAQSNAQARARAKGPSPKTKAPRSLAREDKP